MKLTKSNFDTEIENNKVSLVDFWAAWCGPCRMLTPIMDDVENLFPNSVGKVNVDEERELAAKYGIRSLPTVVFFKDGKVMETIPGVAPKNTYLDKLKYYLN